MNMNTVSASPEHTLALPVDAPAAATTVFKLLRRLRHGSVTVQLPDGSMQRFGGDASPHGSLCLHNWNVFSAVLKSGDIGFAETYIAGDWTTPNLAELLRVMLKNRQEIEGVIFGSWIGQLFYRIKHWSHRNTRANSQKNIHAHYDLGNAFYQLWLDPSMNYSSALFSGELSQPMEAAQRAKVRRALELVQAKSGDRVLEIGCGWGALAEMATAEFGAGLVGVTLSTEQLEFARERMQRHGVAHMADLRLQDYRDIPDAPFDAICSIEMIEAVGREFWPEYFRTIAQKLKPGGRACIQSIVIADELYERYIRSTDFIQQYIFPGGCLPCPREFHAQARAAGLQVVDEYAFGKDYAETLRRWRETFTARRAEVIANGFDDRFIRIWEFYLAYCESAFDEGSTDVLQYTLQKPAH
jgi:cyclopropane-fatty-acyl-phospholipid synthase